MKTGNYLILRDEREVPKTADIRCFAAREEWAHTAARTLTEDGVALAPAEKKPNGF